MLPFAKWLEIATFPERPWLVLGKGPTFSQLTYEQAGEFNLFGLNHVVRHVPLEIAHLIDLDVVRDVGPILLENCRWLLMPRRPHLGCRAGARLLEDYFTTHPVLAELARRGRLVAYNCSTSPPADDGPVIRVDWFSSEAAFEILGRLGARTVHTLGIDGGRSYSAYFADLADTTRLANGHLLFDRQFPRIAEICARHGIDWRSAATPLSVRIAARPAERVPAAVLEYSVRKHATQPVDVETLPLGEHGNGSETRATVERLRARGGRAILLPARALAIGDVAELAALRLAPAAGDPAQPPPHGPCVVDLDALPDPAELPPNLPALPAAWRQHDCAEPGAPGLVLFSRGRPEPWTDPAHPMHETWVDHLAEALGTGLLRYDLVRAAARAGEVAAGIGGRMRVLPEPPPPPDETRPEIDRLRYELRQLRRALAETRASWTWRIGRTVVWPIDRLLRFVARER